MDLLLLIICKKLKANYAVEWGCECDGSKCCDNKGKHVKNAPIINLIKKIHTIF